ncbi:MAG: hypothetical protein M3Q80_01285 [bacterium]|nr:hypothetical protein [bacterium]
MNKQKSFFIATVFIFLQILLGLGVFLVKSPLYGLINAGLVLGLLILFLILSLLFSAKSVYDKEAIFGGVCGIIINIFFGFVYLVGYSLSGWQ